jgi:hypothetical protein
VDQVGMKEATRNERRLVDVTREQECFKTSIASAHELNVPDFSKHLDLFTKTNRSSTSRLVAAEKHRLDASYSKKDPLSGSCRRSRYWRFRYLLVSNKLDILQPILYKVCKIAIHHPVTIARSEKLILWYASSGIALALALRLCCHSAKHRRSVQSGQYPYFVSWLYRERCHAQVSVVDRNKIRSLQ